jgi:hypothetical protein
MRTTNGIIANVKGVFQGKQQIHIDAFKMFGGREGIRTPDPLLAKQVLCQLSYTPNSWNVPIVSHPAHSTQLACASPVD